MTDPTPKFALIPGRANTDVLNLASKIGITTFHSGSAPLTVLFDGNSKDISMLQSQINGRAANSGWNYMTGNILTIKNTKKEDIWMPIGRRNQKVLGLFRYRIKVGTEQPNDGWVPLASLTEACFYKINNKESKYLVN